MKILKKSLHPPRQALVNLCKLVNYVNFWVEAGDEMIVQCLGRTETNSENYHSEMEEKQTRDTAAGELKNTKIFTDK